MGEPYRSWYKKQIIMRKIVQIDESEYNQLVDKANLNEKQIEEKALQMYEERGVAKVELTIKTNSDYYSNRFFKCNASVWYKDSRFFISERLRERLGEFIKEYVQDKVNMDYEKPQRLYQAYQRRFELFKKTQYIFYGIAVSGWAAFVTLLCMN